MLIPGKTRLFGVFRFCSQTIGVFLNRVVDLHRWRKSDASRKYQHGRGRAGEVGQASRLPNRAERRGFRTTKASLRSAGQARRLPYAGGTGKLRPRKRDEAVPS